VSVLAFTPIRAQEEDYPHSELEWKTIETEHFLVHYHDAEIRTGKEVAYIAEQIYQPITSMYQHTPDQKVNIVLRDYDDYSNGASYFYDNKIVIWASSLDYELRGAHPWLQNVISHEFTHIIQIQTAMKLGRRFPGVYFQWLGYEAERRPDVLYGYPNVLVSYPLSAFVVPSWFAEGVAQFNNPHLQFDTWDTHRDMILRMYMLEGKPLTWEDMAVFGKTSLGNESSYNAGFSIVRYIARRYGVDKLREISENLSSLTRLTIDGAVQAALGMSGQQLYDEWKREETATYDSVAQTTRASLREGELIEKDGFGNFYPAFSPDGTRLAYISNKGEDYFGLSSVYIYDLNTRTSKKIVDLVRSSLSFSPDSRFLYYSKLTYDNPHWSRVYDIYRYDLVEEKETRLTRGLRAQNPKMSPDGAKLVFAYGNDGTLNIGTCDSDGRNVKNLTAFKDGEQVYTPVWSPDEKVIAFGYSIAQNQHLASINADGTDLKITSSDNDSRNPSYSPDGKTIYFADDRSGIFNVYAMEVSSRSVRKITNVLGGAFLPCANARGQIVFASYAYTGYKIAVVQDSIDVGRSVDAPTFHDLASTNIQQSDGSASTVNSHRYDLPDADSLKAGRSYKSIFTSLSILPLIRVDNYNTKNSGWDIVKPGFYFSSSDVLDKLDLFGGAAINRHLERDLFFIFDYRDRLPLLYQLGLEPALSLELYNISRKTDASFYLSPSPRLISTTVTYDLLEFDASLSQPIFSELNTVRLGYTLSRYNANIGSFVHPLLYVVVPAFRSTYLIGNTISLKLRHNGIVPNLERDINPTGRTVTLNYSLELNKFNPNGDFDFNQNTGEITPRYTKYDFNRLELTWNEHLPFFFQKHTLTVSVRAGSILDRPVDSFFDFYAGGIAGMKGYPFYALGGNKVGTVNLTYRFPISTQINFRLLQFYFTKLYASVFTDYGDAWTGSSIPNLTDWKKDVGAELRLESFSFYAYPTRIFVSGAYGLDKFTREFGTTNVTYGNEWRFYLGILFGFEVNDFVPRLRN
jgi:Tol biopolymer transport system component